MREVGRRTDEAEAAILPPPIKYGQASANCLSLPLVPGGERIEKGGSVFSLNEKSRALQYRGCKKWLVKHR